MKRILFIMGNMGLGGAETHIMKVYRTVNRNVFQFDFVLNVKEKCYYEDEIYELGGKCYRITPKSSSILQNYNELKKIIREFQYKIVFKCGEHAMSWTEMKAAKDGGASIRIIRSTNSKAGNSLLNRILHYLSRPLLNHYITNRVAPSIEAAKWLFGPTFYKSTTIVNNGVDIEEYQFNILKRNELRNKLHIKKDSIVLGHVGRFSQQKNHVFLINLLSALQNTSDKYFLLLVGEGDMQEKIKSLCKEKGLLGNVFFVGNQKDMQAYYSVMDFFLLPSFYEGLPNVAIEAQANGLHCMLSDTITREVDITGKNWFGEIWNADEWIKYLKNQNPVREDPYQAFFKRKYDIESVTKVYTDMFSV